MQIDFIHKKYEVRSRAMLPVGTLDGVVSYTGSDLGSRLHRSFAMEGGREAAEVSRVSVSSKAKAEGTVSVTYLGVRTRGDTPGVCIYT